MSGERVHQLKPEMSSDDIYLYSIMFIWQWCMYNETADGTIEFLRFDRFQLCFEMFCFKCPIQSIVIIYAFLTIVSNFLPLRWACFIFRPLVEISDDDEHPISAWIYPSRLFLLLIAQHSRYFSPANLLRANQARHCYKRGFLRFGRFFGVCIVVGSRLRQLELIRIIYDDICVIFM